MNFSMKNRFPVSVFLIILLLLISSPKCASKQDVSRQEHEATILEKRDSIDIRTVLQHPAEFRGKEIGLSGTSRGWKGGYGPPPVSRSDWVLEDLTGFIYVTGGFPKGMMKEGRPAVGLPVDMTALVEQTEQKTLYLRFIKGTVSTLAPDETLKKK